MTKVTGYNKMKIERKTKKVKYCKSLKYSGNNKIAIIALCAYALL